MTILVKVMLNEIILKDCSLHNTNFFKLEIVGKVTNLPKKALIHLGPMRSLWLSLILKYITFLSIFHLCNLIKKRDKSQVKKFGTI